MSLQQEIVNNPQYTESFRNIKVYGVAGTNGSGKDVLMDFLETEGFLVYRTGDQLRQISQAVFKTTQRGGNESPMGRIANVQRAFYPGGMVELGLLDWWLRVSHLPAELRPRGLVIGSIRGTGEAARLQELGGKLVVVDAPIKTRYERLKNRGRYYEQAISYEDFVKEERAELAEGETDPTKFGMDAVIRMADILINNASGDIETFKQDIRQALLE